MKVVSIQDYDIHINLYQPIVHVIQLPNGRKHRTTEPRTVFKTQMGEFEEEQWNNEFKEILLASGELGLLESIIEYCKTHCAWLHKEKEIEEYAMRCLASGAYTHWEGLGIQRIPDQKVFVFERGDLN